MGTKLRVAFIIALFVGIALVLAGLVHGHTLSVLSPKGTIAQQQRDLMMIATLLMLLVVVPVFVLTAVIAWRYRATNTKAAYRPDWDGNRKLEVFWWAFPCAIIAVLAVITWTSSHRLDPYRPLASTTKPVTVQVVALPWKWLFIYPEQGIATVNYLEIPEDTPINFEITSDAPMNSFWIPRLGGQVYAMAGMNTQLHLMASEPGSYEGSSANLSGQGFSGMRFETKATTRANFDQWVSRAQQSNRQLSTVEYQKLARPSENAPVATYAKAAPGLYDEIIMKYMMPAHEGSL